MVAKSKVSLVFIVVLPALGLKPPAMVFLIMPAIRAKNVVNGELKRMPNDSTISGDCYVRCGKIGIIISPTSLGNLMKESRRLTLASWRGKSE